MTKRKGENPPLRCNTCGVEFPGDEFWSQKYRKYRRKCRACLRKGQADRRQLSHGQRARAKKKPTRQSRWWKTYNAYLESPAWTAKKAEYWRDGEHKHCFVCRRPRHPGMQLHHRTYERMGHEDLNDLVPVCVGCHDRITRFSRANRKTMTLWEATEAVAARYREAASRLVQ